jgi:hypothetical protein
VYRTTSSSISKKALPGTTLLIDEGGSESRPCRWKANLPHRMDVPSLNLSGWETAPATVLGYLFVMRCTDHLAFFQSKWSQDNPGSRAHPWLRRIPSILASGRRFHRPKIYLWLLRREPATVVPLAFIPVFVMTGHQRAIPWLFYGVAGWRVFYDQCFGAPNVSRVRRLWHVFGKLALGLASASYCVALAASATLGLVFSCGLSGLHASTKVRVHWPARKSH